MEKAPDTEFDFFERESRAKQPIAGTAEVGGQRRGHPKLMGAKNAQAIWVNVAVSGPRKP